MFQSFPQTASVHELQRSYRSLIDRAKKEREPLFLLKNNKPESVLIDYSLWENIRDAWELADAREAIRVSEKEEKEGKLKVLKSLKDLM